MVGRFLRETLVIINVCSILVQAEDFLELYVPRPEYPIQLNDWLSAVQDHRHDFDSIRKAAIEDRRMKKRDLLNLALDAANVEDLEGLDKQPTNDIYPYMYRTNKKSTKSVSEEPESSENTFKKTYRSPLRLRRDSYRADLEKINNVDVKSKGLVGEIKRSDSKYPERYVRSKSDDNKDINFKRKRDIQIDVLSDGKLLKEIKNDKGGRSVVLNIQSVADAQAPDMSTFNTENSQSKDAGTITDLMKSVGNIGKVEKQLVASPGLVRVQGNKESNFRNKNDIVAERSGELGIIKQSPTVEKLKENDPNFKNLFNENDKLNTDISMAKDTLFPSTIPSMVETNAANLIQQQQNELHQNPQNALKFYNSFTNNGLQDMSKFWSPTEKSLMQAGIQIAQGMPDSKSEVEGFEEVTSMVIDNKADSGVNINKKYPNKRQLDEYASKLLGDGYFVKENDVVRQLADLTALPNAGNIVVTELTVDTNGEIPASPAEGQIHFVQDRQDVLDTNEFNSSEEISKTPEDLSNTVYENEECSESTEVQNEKDPDIFAPQNPLSQSNKDIPNSIDDQNKINSNAQVALAPKQQFDGSNISPAEQQSGSVETCTHIIRKDKFFIGHQVVTEIETVKELEPNMKDEDSKDTVNMLINMKGKEKEAEHIPEGIKSELAGSTPNQEDKECSEGDSQQFDKDKNLEAEQHSGMKDENKQSKITAGSLENNSKHKETFSEHRGVFEGKNMSYDEEQQNPETVKELPEVSSKHEKPTDNEQSEHESKDIANVGQHHPGAIGGNTEETAIEAHDSPDIHKETCNEHQGAFEGKNMGYDSEQQNPENAKESPEVSSKHEKPTDNEQSEHESKGIENVGEHHPGAIGGNAEETAIEAHDNPDMKNIEHKHHETFTEVSKSGSQVESEECSEVEPNNGSDEYRNMEHSGHASGSVGENTECNDMEDVEHEYSGTDEEKHENHMKDTKTLSEHQENAESENVVNEDHHNSGIVEETADYKLKEAEQPEMHAKNANVEADTGKNAHNNHREGLERTELEKQHTKDHIGVDNLSNAVIAQQDSQKHDRIGDHYSSHIGEAVHEEGNDNTKESEENLQSETNEFETTECQLELEENTDNGEHEFNSHHHSMKEEEDETENYAEDHHKHHHHEHLGDLEEEQDNRKMHRQHDGTQVIVINNARIKDGAHEIEAEHFLSPQSRRRKNNKIKSANKRNFKNKSAIAKHERHTNRNKFVRKRRKMKARRNRQQGYSGIRYKENNGYDYNKHYIGRRLKEADIGTHFEKSYGPSEIYYNVMRKTNLSRNLESGKLDIEDKYIGRKLKAEADYIYDPSIEKSEESYDSNDATDISDVTEKRQAKIKGAVEGDYGDEEDSMTEKKNGGKKMIKNTKNEFAHPRTTTEAADDDDYYDEIEGMGEGEKIHNAHRATREPLIVKEKNANIGRKAEKNLKKLKEVGSPKVHAVKSNKGKITFREPRQSDYAKTNPEFQQWPKFMINDQENEEKLRKRSLITKKPAKRKREKFKKSLKDFFLKPAPKKRFDMDSMNLGGGSTVSSGEDNIKTCASEKKEGSSVLDASSDIPVTLKTTPNECHLPNTTNNVSGTIESSSACGEEALNTSRPALSTVLSILDQKELESEMGGKSTEMPKLDDILDGRLPSMIRDEVQDQVKNNENFKKFQAAFRTSKTHISNQTDTNSVETNKMLRYMMQIIDKLQFATTCQVLPPSLRNYLKNVTNVPRDDALKRLRDMEEIQLDENQNDPNNNYLFRAHAPMDKLEDKAKLLEELLEKYNKLPDQCKPRAEPVREYIENHLGLVNKMLSGQESSKKAVRRAKDFKRSKPEPTKSEDLVEQQLESLGLGKSKTFKANFDLDELVTRHRRQKSILFEDEEEYTPEKGSYDVREDGRTVSTKYSKLLKAVEQEKEKHQMEQTLGKVYGESNLDYYESPKEKREASNYNFETPLVYSL